MSALIGGRRDTYTQVDFTCSYPLGVIVICPLSSSTTTIHHQHLPTISTDSVRAIHSTPSPIRDTRQQLISTFEYYNMMDTKLPEARLPQEFILDAFADPSSVRDVVRGKPLLPTSF